MLDIALESHLCFKLSKRKMPEGDTFIIYFVVRQKRCNFSTIFQLGLFILLNICLHQGALFGNSKYPYQRPNCTWVD